MTNINNVENLTQAYIVAYNTALKAVKNPDLAVHMAMSVIATIYMIDSQNKPKDPFSQLAESLQMAALKSMMNQNHKENTESDSEGKEDDET